MLITDVSAAITASVGGITAAGVAFRVLYMSNGDDFTMHESLRNQRRPVVPGESNERYRTPLAVGVVGMILPGPIQRNDDLSPSNGGLRSPPIVSSVD